MGCGQSVSHESWTHQWTPTVSLSSKPDDDKGDHKEHTNFFNDYLLDKKIHAGAFGQIHGATMNPHKIRKGTASEEYADRRLDHSLSVKAIDMRLKSKQIRKLLHCEIETWKSLGNHKNCAEFLEVQASSGICFIVIEKCSCGLLPYLDSFPSIDERILGDIFAQMLVGIEFLHRSDIIHRNIKPDSFLIGGDGNPTVKLCDFSLAKRVEGKKLRGECGTPLFISPEMLLGGFYTDKTDTWSFGVIVYALFFGRFPYDFDDLNSREVKAVITKNKEDPHFSDMPLPLTEDALDFVKSLLIRNPIERVSVGTALSSSYMKAIADGTHASDFELSNLKPMFDRVRRVRSFENKSLKQKTAIDDILNSKQMEKHGVPVPGIDDIGMVLQGQAGLEAPWKKRRNSLGEDTTSTKSSLHSKTSAQTTITPPSIAISDHSIDTRGSSNDNCHGTSKRHHTTPSYERPCFSQVRPKGVGYPEDSEELQ